MQRLPGQRKLNTDERASSVFSTRQMTITAGRVSRATEVEDDAALPRERVTQLDASSM